MWVGEFTASGSYPFPFDMLRYDGCFPSASEDATTLFRLEGGVSVSLRLKMYGNTKPQATPTSARWHSFGWQVCDFRQWKV